MNTDITITLFFAICTVIGIIWFLSQPLPKNTLYKFYLVNFKDTTKLYEYSFYAFSRKEAQIKLIYAFFMMNNEFVFMKTEVNNTISPILHIDDVAISNIFLHLTQDKAFGRIISGIGTVEGRKWFEKLLVKLKINLDENGKRRVFIGSPAV